jgi:CHAT domain-containing protein
LIELIELDGVLRAVVVDADGISLRRLGAVARVEMEKRHLLFALRRLTNAPAGSAPARRAGQAAEDAAAALERLLVRPLHVPVGADLIIVPTGLLHGLPWAALPALRNGSVELTPSAGLWLRPPPRPRGQPKVVLVAGPDLVGAELEVARLSTIYPRASVLAGDQATSAAVLDAFARADLLHICAHGQFRADSALFSRLALADGPLTVYDVEGVRCRASTVVLPACEAAVAEVLAGDEVIGTAAALLGNGVHSVIAPVLPIPDLASVEVMVLLHRGLREGLAPARALAAAVRQTYAGGDPQAVASASAFVCIGSDRGAPTA